MENKQVIKKLILATLVATSSIAVAGAVTIPQAIVEVEAASAKLNATKLTLKNVRTYTLKVKNNKKKVKWSSSKSSVASVNSSGKVTAKKNGTCYISAKFGNKTLKCKVTVQSPAKKTTSKTTSKTYKVDIPTYNQSKEGYPRGCEGVSFYMALKGKGYLNNVSLKSFMDSMPKTSTNPNYGYVGDPTKSSSAAVNKGKRTTIHPAPAVKWIKSQYTSNVKNASGYSTTQLKTELRKGNPIVVWVTGGWATPKWTKYSWGKTVSNNHALCLVGYNTSTGKYLVNDCAGSRNGTYWVAKSTFEKCYNARKYAVVIS